MATTTTQDARNTTSYITFRLGDEHFAVDVRHVREVLELSIVTRLPLAPAHLRGVVNVRGSAVSVVDLRSKFGLPRVADTLQSRVIVVEFELDGEACVLGGLADAVHEVVELDAADIHAPPTTGMRWKPGLIRGISRRGEQFLIILDTDQLFTSDDLLTGNGAGDASTVAAAAP